MGLFDKLKDPIFLKETSSAQQQLEELRALVDKVGEEDKKKMYLCFGMQESLWRYYDQ